MTAIFLTATVGHLEVGWDKSDEELVASSSFGCIFSFHKSRECRDCDGFGNMRWLQQVPIRLRGLVYFRWRELARLQRQCEGRCWRSGYVGAAALVGTLTSSPTGGNAVASASVNYSLTISTPASYTGGDIPVQVLFGLFGSVGGSTDTNASENSLRQARIDAVYTLTGL